MYLERLALTDFRSYPQLELRFEPGATALVGFNGVGKTNVVEAIGYFASLSSHRVSQDAPMLRFGTQVAYIRGTFVRGKRQLGLEVELVPGKSNRARINRANPVRAREILGLVKTILFAPEDLGLVKNEPAVRRAYLDAVMVQNTGHLAALLADYERVLKQRNALLRQAKLSGGFTSSHEASLAAWDEQLVSLGTYLTIERDKLVDALRPHFSRAYTKLTDGSKPADIRYESQVLQTFAPSSATPGLGENDAEAGAASPSSPADTVRELADHFREQLRAQRGKEIARGQSLYGPHRDDVVISLGQAPAKGFASHGETWSLALSLRLAAYDLMRESDPREGMDPILILDDVFAELDARRREKLTALVAKAEQVIITAAVEEDIPESLHASRIYVSPGRASVRKDSDGGSPAETEPAASTGELDA